MLLLRFLFLALFASGLLASSVEVVQWDGVNTLPQVNILVGDTVVWTAAPSLSETFSFYLDNVWFPTNTTYSYTFTKPGKVMAFLMHVNYVTTYVNVKIPHFFDPSITEYHLNRTDIIRWEWDETQPELPTMFEGTYGHPGFSRMTDFTYDYLFTFPGVYSWVMNMQVYTFYIPDPYPPLNQINIPWGPEVGDLVVQIHSNYIPIRFYSTQNGAASIQINEIVENGIEESYKSTSYPFENNYWYDMYFQREGLYIARSKNENETMTVMFNFTIPSSPPNHHHSNDNKHSTIPKSLIFVAEMSLFMIGALGLGHYLVSQLDTKHRSLSVPLSDSQSEADEGEDGITSYALSRAEERMSKEKVF
jgi:hypothetical protein